MAAKKGAAPKKPAPKGASDEKMLKRYQHHNNMADKHRAHAELIRAKLRTQGKDIDEYGYSPMASSKPHKPKIIKRPI